MWVRIVPIIGTYFLTVSCGWYLKRELYQIPLCEYISGTYLWGGGGFRVYNPS